MIHQRSRLKLLFVLGSRGEWGYIRPVIDEARRRGHEPSIAAANMAVLSRYGDLASAVETQGYEVTDRIFSAFEGDLHTTMAKSLFAAGNGMVDVLAQRRPDWLVLAGDRAEQLGAAIAGSFTYTPTAHIQAGEVSGNIDDTSRHAIARLAHLHFASNEDAVERLMHSGEQPWRILKTGAPQLDDVARRPDGGLGAVKQLHIQAEDFCLAIFHPVTENRGEMASQMKELFASIDTEGRHCVWVLPNNDAGGLQIRELVESRSRVTNSVFINLERELYLGLVQASSYMIGNSSSGILEAPTFGTPAINIGRRQLGRVRGPNVIDVEPDCASILAGIRKALDPDFRQVCAASTNPYGDGHASERILDALESTPVDERLVTKRLTI